VRSAAQVVQAAKPAAIDSGMVANAVLVSSSMAES
jgi:hypothetical protein